MHKVSRFSKELDFLKPAFEQFSENLDQYGNVFDWEELPHYFNERATISFLQAACWQCGLISMEEYVTKKYVGEEENDGRCDLYICQKRGQRTVEIEAKQRLLVPGTRDGTIKGWFLEGDLDACKNQGADLQASLTFVMPRVPVSAEFTEEEYLEVVQNALNIAMESGIHAVHFWCHPKAWKHEEEPRGGGEMARWPGLLSLLRVVNLSEDGEAKVGPNTLNSPIRLA
ncbi:hypothetical protein [Thalassospira tepidiphila]|uniref:Uncharacterized protein n=2 Tax=Thalassospira tepidiphila TaxID=393657 RepID=A0A853L0D6_9PROT|nr:hypothetical protein [Thalassospira tepidiphila]NJB74701.1 hypothetical protein [Thalassospira tepidiphila]OAZ10116.1 hypothetical protein TH4_07605 [Thalassospira tepidiphila MCCC 1A03514]